MAYDMALRDMLRGRQPELTVNDVKLLSGLSGESIAQVLKPAASAVEKARPNYHHGIIRILQMAVSVRIDAGLSSVAGATSGDEAYRRDLLAFAFAPTPSLPPTIFDQLRLAQVDEAPRQSKLTTAKLAQGITSSIEQIKLAGYSQADAERIDREKSQQPTTEVM
jgi:hypothetical protein